jgi:ankyrin repeat protein
MWHVALRRGHADVAQLLLDVGADSDAESRDIQYFTAPHYLDTWKLLRYDQP